MRPLALTLLPFIATATFSASAATPKPAKWVLPDTPAHCAITLSLKKKTGETETLVFRTALKTPEQCRKLAQLHEPNFNADVDESKAVKFAWDGPRPGKKLAHRGTKRRS